MDTWTLASFFHAAMKRITRVIILSFLMDTWTLASFVHAALKRITRRIIL
jgi:hypothetical protein